MPVALSRTSCVPAPQHSHIHSGVSRRLPTAAAREMMAVLGCPPGDSSHPFWQTHFCPMLLCLTPAAAPGSQSLCCLHLDFPLLPTCMCSPFPMWHHEGLGCLSWSWQHRETGRWAVLAHSDARFLVQVKSRKGHFADMLGFQRKWRGGEERQIAGLGDCGLQNQKEMRHCQEAFTPLGWHGEQSGPAGACTVQAG